jgi:hypothetical protein
LVHFQRSAPSWIAFLAAKNSLKSDYRDIIQRAMKNKEEEEADKG